MQQSPRSEDAVRGIGFLLRDVSRLNAHNFERRAAELGLTLAQCRALCYVQRFEGVSQARLAECSDTDPMTLARALQRLEAEGYLARRPDPHDGRARRLVLLPKAQPLLDRIWKLADESRAEALAGLQPAERKQLVELLARVRDNLAAALQKADAC